MDASAILARAATLRKTGNRTSLELPTKPAPKPAPKPVPPKPVASRSRDMPSDSRQMRVQDSFDDLAIPKVQYAPDSYRERSQTLKHTMQSGVAQHQHRIPYPYEVNIPSQKQSSVSTNCLPDPEDAYDDIESVKEQMKSYTQAARNFDEPPPLPPMNSGLIKSTSNDCISNSTPSVKRASLSQPTTLLKRPAIPQSVQETPPSPKTSRSPSTPSQSSIHLPSQLSKPPSRLSLPSPSFPAKASTAVNISSSHTSQCNIGPMPICELVEKHEHEFPLLIEVYKGTPKSSVIARGERYYVHFIKTTEVVKLTTSGGNYVVPLNSAVLFGPIYNPANRLQDAIQGYFFNTAGEIMSAQYLPHAVYAQKTFDASSMDSSVQAGEILIVKEITKHRFRSRSLTCTAVGTGQNKKLIENCEGSFSTAPADLKLSLPEVVDHLSLPQECILYYEGLNAPDVLSQLPSGAVILQELQSLQTLIVTKLPCSDDVSGTPSMLELPFNSDILVQIISPSDLQMSAALAEKSLKLYNSFSPVLIDSVSLLTSETPYQLQRQAALLSVICYDKSLSRGITIKLPEKLKNLKLEDKSVDDVHRFPGYQAEKGQNRSWSPDSHYDIPQTSSIHSIPQMNEDEYDIPRPISVQPIPKPPLLSNEVKCDEKNVQSEINFLKIENESLRITVSTLEKLVQNILQKTDQLQKDVAALQRNSESNTQLAGYDDTPENNRRFLYSLTFQHVQVLLKEMHLHEYMKTFLQDQIDGPTLCTLDEAMLHELGVASKLHRIKLLNVISGRSSARAYLERDTYVKCYKK